MLHLSRRIPLVLMLAHLAGAATLPYQGLATDSKGNPRADGAVPVAFALYASATGGSAAWSESQSVTTRKGLFSTSLGSVTSIPDSLLDGRALWLGVALDGGAEALPRLAIQAPIYAARAGQARHAAVADSAGRVAGLLDSIRTLRALVRELADRDSARQARDSVRLRQDSIVLAGFAALLKGVSRVGTELSFDSVNLSVRNGLGRTDTANGLGNLVVGYNERRDGSQVGRSGSHMLVAGMYNDFTSFGGIVAGTSNTTTGQFASITGGISNTANGLFSSVSGGQSNAANGMCSSVSGGMSNTAKSLFSSVSGGQSNQAIGSISTISGGSGNTASGEGSTVVGGRSNTASGFDSTILGGSSQTLATDGGTLP